MQLKLRDIEVANDDFERQARNTTSSLEDLESKYNVSIERGVLLEEEIKSGEQEREALRIETQRLRDELSDLKVEAEIRQDKLRHAEAATTRRQLRKPTPIGTNITRPRSSVSQHSPTTTTSSPTIATPPTKSASSGASDAPTPPSPPVSDKSIPPSNSMTATAPSKSRLSIPSAGVTPRPSHYSARPARHSRGPSIPVTTGLTTPSVSRRTTLNRPESQQETRLSQTAPSSASLTHIRGLMGKMQKLEQRVHSVRSRLPAPNYTPPRASPRASRPSSSLSQSYIPSSVTVRSKRRTGGSNYSAASSIHFAKEVSDLAPIATQQTSHPSYGMPPPSPSPRDGSHTDVLNSRPSSRASLHSRQSFSQLSRPSSRPTSRQSVSISGARTPLGHYSSSTTGPESRQRPSSSMSGSYPISHGHGHSASVSHSSNYNNFDENIDGGDVVTPTPSRRTTMSKEGTGIPLPGTIGKRQSGTGLPLPARRISAGLTGGEMGPPLERKTVAKKRSGIGETY